MGDRGCIPDAPGETGIHLEWKQRTPLCSRVATGRVQIRVEISFVISVLALKLVELPDS